MTSDNLLKFLGNREYLHQVSYQELKSMVVQYPYSLSLRYLLAMKSQQEDNTDLSRNIELLATYGIDRAHLHQVFSEDPIVLEDLEESIVMGEDFLELKELSTLERAIEETQFIQPENNLNFLEEKLSTNQQSPVLEEIPVLPLAINGNDLKAIEEEEIVPRAPATTDEPELSTEKINQEIIPEREEEFVEMNFESPFENEENIGIPTTPPEVAPSESFVVRENDFDENGLPADAIEVNDLFVEEETKESFTVEELFSESEEEAIAEEAVSDSTVFMENPEEVLVEESQKVLEISQTEEESLEQANQNIPENSIPSSEKINIPFEVNYSETDPHTLANPSIAEEETVIEPAKIVEKKPSEQNLEMDADQMPSASSEETTTQETVKEVKPEKKSRLSKQRVSFKFDSLNQFEVDLQRNSITSIAQPIPKTKFQSWQAKYSGIDSFSSTTLVPISGNGGKIIKRKKKVIQKKFEKTVALAEESLKMDTHIASETLAQLLVKQGQYSRAKTMYQALSLTMPEKSSFFAAEIEKIANLPDEDS